LSSVESIRTNWSRQDLTDKFDFTFLFGDLNFRLNIKRLHADWLISRKGMSFIAYIYEVHHTERVIDYAQALTFDQLKDLMDKQEAFVGFQEGPIDFPPTFKYDVLRTLKVKHRDSKLHRWKSQDRVQRLTEVHEKPAVDAEEEEDQDTDAEADADATSVASSMWTSTRSRHALNEAEDEFFATGSAKLQHSASTPSSKRLSRVATKAKVKWIELTSPSSPVSPVNWLKVKSKSKALRSKQSSNPSSEANVEGKLLVPVRSTSLDGSPRRQNSFLAPPSMSAIAASSLKSSIPSDDEINAQSDKGVYDSSSKKRVPSW
jgi:hypothetical protein